MFKTVIKETLIMILLCSAIALLFGIAFYDYIPINKVIPNKVAYQVPEEIKNELEVQVSNERQSITLTYEIDGTDLSKYKKSGSYNEGKINPFDTFEENQNYYTEGTGSGNSNQTSGTIINATGK